MISSFKFAFSHRLIFGSNSFQELPVILGDLGENILLITGKSSLESSGRLGNFLDSGTRKGFKIFHVTIPGGEPSVEFIDKVVAEFCKQKIDAVVAIGGGSALDAGKAISAMLPLNMCDGDGKRPAGDAGKVVSIVDYLEGVGDKKHPGDKIPFVAVPTTAGTGSEATKNAVIKGIWFDQEKQTEIHFKKSLRHDNFIPDIAVLDPQLLLECPFSVSAACALDALTQLMESYLSRKSNPLSDTLALNGLEHVKFGLHSLLTGKRFNEDSAASMMYAATLSGITLANAGLGIVHGIASTMGGMFDIPHGVVCGTLLGAATRMNISKAGHISPEKFLRVAKVLTGERDLNRCISVLDNWTEKLVIPRLGNYGIKEDDLRLIADQSKSGNNLVDLNKDEIYQIMKSRL